MQQYTGEELSRSSEAYTNENGKFYENFPLGGRREISQEEYNNALLNAKEVTAKRQQEKSAEEQFQIDLKNLGYIEFRSGYGIDVDGYKKRLYDVLTGKNFRQIEAPVQTDTDKSLDDNSETQHIAEVDLNTSIAISQIFSLSVTGAQDYYRNNIEVLLDEYERVVTQRILTEDQYAEIVRLFLLGHVNDQMLFRRFEKLKKDDRKYSLQRIYKYGLDYQDALPEDPSMTETDWMEEHDGMMIAYELRDDKVVSMADLEPSEEKIHEKLKQSCMHYLKNSIVGHSLAFQDPYMHSLLPDTEDIYDSLTEEEKGIIDEKTKKSGFMPNKSNWESMLTYERNAVVLVTQGKIPTPRFMSQFGDGQVNMIHERQKAQYGSSFNSRNMQEVFRFSKDELNKIVIEAKVEFVTNFLSFVEHISFDNFDDFAVTRKGLNIQNLYKARILIKDAAEYYKIDVDSLEMMIKDNLIAVMKNGLERLKNKELLDKSYYRKDATSMRASYKLSLSAFKDKLKPLSKTMKEFQLEQSSEYKDWIANSEQYGFVYLDHHQGGFTAEGRNKTINKYNLNAEDTEKFREQIMQVAKDKLYLEVKKNVYKEKKKYGRFPFSTISKKNIYQILNKKVLFHSGLSTLVKHHIPDHKERKVFRDTFKKDLSENCLKEVLERLSNKDTADHASYLMWEPLLQMFKFYGGKQRVAEITIDRVSIEENYKNFVKENIANDVKPEMNKIKRFIKGKSKEEVIYAYGHFATIDGYLHSFIVNYLQKNFKINKDDQTIKIHQKCFEDNKNIFGKDYPGNYLMLISRMGYKSDEIGNYLPKDLLNAFIAVFQSSQNLKKEFFENMIPTWLQMNLGPGGKIKRIIEEKTAGIDDSAEAVQYTIQYIAENLQDIVLHDVAQILVRREQISRPTQDIIKEIVARFLNERKAKFGQRGVQGRASHTELGESIDD